MGEPAIRVLFFSELFGLFTDGVSSAAAAYARLAHMGMLTVFVTEKPMAQARAALDGLEPAAPVIAAGGTWYCPPGHPLAGAFAEMVATSPEAGAVIAALIEAVRRRGDYPIPIAIAPSDASYLIHMQLAAVTGSGGGSPASPALYRCRARGPAAWEEWADLMTRRIRIILSRDEMRERDNGSGSGAQPD
jgi:hypothetical protein